MFRAQFDAGSALIDRAQKSPPFDRFAAVKLAEWRSDRCAAFVARFIANELKNASSEYGVLRQNDSEWFWSLVIDRAVAQCEKNHLQQ